MIPQRIINLIKVAYKDIACRIHHEEKLLFEKRPGVEQECLLSPALFPLIIYWIMKTTVTINRK